MEFEKVLVILDEEGKLAICDDNDHKRTLAEIETLMDAKSNTKDGDRLDSLVTLVEAYEAHAHPIGEPLKKEDSNG